MIIVMDMSTGERLEQQADYSDEVLNAGWMPTPEVALGLQEYTPEVRRTHHPVHDADALLRNFYLYQQ